EQIGHVRYNVLLNDFFYDITEPIIESGGEIYQYVGDEIVVTWRPATGLAHASCIGCYFDVRDKIDSLADSYREKFQLVPGFKAGFHIGPVIAGEVGDIKKAIAFHGDVVNTTSRILSECRPMGKELLLSADLL